jgi:ketosteroid isomerase-like protein
MNESSNVQAVKAAYDAFLRGDIDAILAMLDENVEWQAVKGTEGVAPHAGVRRGPGAVKEFFAQVAATIQFSRFEPKEYIAQGDQVAVVGEYSARIATTGRSVTSDWVMVFTFRNGRMVRFREWTDSAQLVRAYGASAAA